MNEKERNHDFMSQVTGRLIEVAEIVLRQKREEQADLRQAAAGIAKYIKETGFAEFPGLNKLVPEYLTEFDEFTTGLAVTFMLQSSRLANRILPNQPHLGFPADDDILINALIQRFPFNPPALPVTEDDGGLSEKIRLSVQRAFCFENEDQVHERQLKNCVAKYMTETALTKYPALKDISADEIRRFGKIVTAMSMFYTYQASSFAFMAENAAPPQKATAKKRGSKKQKAT